MTSEWKGVKRSRSEHTDLDRIGSSEKRRFTRLLMKWAAEQPNIRTFPWRCTSDAYLILIAELLLRRTNAASAEKIYLEFVNRYPGVREFSQADPADLRSLVCRLGLNWRAENMVELAQRLKRLESGALPDSTVSEIETLPGVGPYIARAIMINAAGAALVAVDTNVVRVLSRYFGIPASDNLRRNRRFQAFADSCVYSKDPRTFNFALLDLAAKICRAGEPLCPKCSLMEFCATAKTLEPGSARRSVRRK